jgi:hypothetical protein
MTDQEVTLGEIYRSLQRLEAAFLTHQSDTRIKNHDLVAKIQEAIMPLGALHIRVQSAEDRLDKLEPRVDTVAVNAAFMAGGIALLGFVISMVWK